MVSDSVTVESLSAVSDPASSQPAIGYEWVSDGSGEYTMAVSENNLSRGSKITLKLKENCSEFADPARIKDIIKKYRCYINHDK
jgi:molecular chaperone HtpG